MIENHFVKIKGVQIPEIIEFPLESDNSLSIDVLVSQFPRATELKYLNRETDKIEIVPRIDDKFYFSANLRSDDLLFFSYGLDSIRNSEKDTLVKKKTHESFKSVYSRFPKTFDLLIMGLSYDTTESHLKKYVSRFGELKYCKLKMDTTTKESKGIGYLRFNDEYHQNRCLNATHLIDKTKIIIKIPIEKLTARNDQDFKIYVYNISPSITREELRVYFSQFGLILDISKPSDKKNYAFITFCDSASLNRVITHGQSHTFNGGRVNVNRMMARWEYQTASKSLGNGDKNKSNGLKRNSSDLQLSQDKQIKIAHSGESLNIAPYLQYYGPTKTPYNNIDYRVPPYRTQYGPINTPTQVSSSYYSTPNNVTATSNHFVNQSDSLRYFGNHGTSNPQGHNVSDLPISTTYPPPMTYQSNPPTEIPSHASYVYNNTTQQSSQVIPVQSREEQNQLHSLVNQFIQEIKNNLTKLSDIKQ